MSSTAENAVAYLSHLASDLAAEYTRPSLQGRLDQVRSIIDGLGSLISQLPDEEAREAEYANRLLALHDAGFFNPDNADHRHQHPSEAVDRLRHAIASRNGEAE